jgi:hypothetical protein
VRILKTPEEQASFEAARRASLVSARLRAAESGIRRYNAGWAAICDGRLVEEFTGAGSKRAAIEAAGTNAVIA